MLPHTPYRNILGTSLLLLLAAPPCTASTSSTTEKDVIEEIKSNSEKRAQNTITIINQFYQQNKKNPGTTFLYTAIVQRKPTIMGFLIDEKKVNVNTPYNNHSLLYHSLSKISHKGKDIGLALLNAGHNVNTKDKDDSGNSLLHMAIQNKYTEVASELIRKGAYIHATNNTNQTPLHLAIINKQPAVIEALLAKDANIHATDNDEDTPLHLAVQYKQPAVIEALVKKGANIQKKNKSHNTPLSMAIDLRNGNDNIAISLIKHKKSITLRKDNYGSTILHWVIQKRNTNIAVPLIDKVTNLDIQDDNRQTPLYVAIANGQKEIAQALIQHQNQITLIQASSGYTALHWAIVAGYTDIAFTDIALTLIPKVTNLNQRHKNINKQTPLHLAIWKDQKKIALTLIQHQKKITLTQDSSGYTSLHLAIHKDYTDIALALIPKVTNLNQSDKYGNIPLHLAISQDKTEIVQALIQRQNKIILTQDSSDNTFLHLAIQQGHIQTALALIPKVSNLDLQNDSQQTPLHLAFDGSNDNDNQRIAQALIQQQKKITLTKDYLGRMPLHLAIEKGYTQTALILIPKVTNLDAQNKRKQTPLHLTFDGSNRNHNQSIAQALIQQQNQITLTQDYLGETPLHLAIQKGYNNIALALIPKVSNIDEPNEYGKTPLYLAVEGNSYTIVQKLMQYKANPNKTTKANKTTPYQRALAKQNQNGFDKKIINLLKPINIKPNRPNKGNSINIKNNNNIPPKPNKKISLINKNPTPTKQDVMNAIRNHSTSTAQKTINIINQFDLENNKDAGTKFLYTAIEEDHLDIVNLLISKKVDVNTIHRNKSFLYHFLRFNNKNQDIGLALLKAGHNAKAKDKDDSGNTLLHMAIQNKYTEVALQLIQKGANIRATNLSNSTPLHLAVYYEQQAVIKLLVEKGANIQQENTRKETPLSLAAHHNEPDLVNILTKDKNNIQLSKNNIGFTILHLAILQGKTNFAFALIPKVSNIDEPSNQGYTPLYLAVQGNKYELVDILIQYKADPNKTTKANKTTPYELALGKQSKNDFDKRIVKRLNSINIKPKTFQPNKNIDNNNKSKTPQPNIPNNNNNTSKTPQPKPINIKNNNNKRNNNTSDKNNNTPPKLNKNPTPTQQQVMNAIKNHSTNSAINIINQFDLQNNKDAGTTFLYTAIVENQLDIVNLLIPKKVDVNTIHRKKSFLYHFLSFDNKNQDIGLALLNAGHNAKAKDKDDSGNTLLHMAIQNKYTEVALQLIQKGANIHATNISNNTPLHLAVKHRQQAVIEALVAKDANIQQENITSDTPLSLAVNYNEINLVNTLIKDKNNIQLRKTSSPTLHWAIKKSYTNIALALIPKVTNIDEPDTMGSNPLYLAVENNNYTIIEKLIQYNANPNTPHTILRITPYQLALQKQHESDFDKRIVNLLKPKTPQPNKNIDNNNKLNNNKSKTPQPNISNNNNNTSKTPQPKPTNIKNIDNNNKLNNNKSKTPQPNISNNNNNTSKTPQPKPTNIKNIDNNNKLNNSKSKTPQPNISNNNNNTSPPDQINASNNNTSINDNNNTSPPNNPNPLNNNTNDNTTTPDNPSPISPQTIGGISAILLTIFLIYKTKTSPSKRKKKYPPKKKKLQATHQLRRRIRSRQ